jgi:hypothetical protein
VSLSIGLVARATYCVAVAAACVCGAGFGSAMLLAGLPLLWQRWRYSGEPKAFAVVVVAALAAMVGAALRGVHGMREARVATVRDKSTPLVRPVVWLLFGIAAASLPGLPDRLG